MSAGRRLGRQAPAVLAAPRRAPGVLTKASAGRAPDAQAIRALQVAHGTLKTEHEALRDDLAAALDAWEVLAEADEIRRGHARGRSDSDLETDQARIDALRKRWGITATETAPDDQDLTDATAER